MQTESAFDHNQEHRQIGNSLAAINDLTQRVGWTRGSRGARERERERKEERSREKRRREQRRAEEKRVEERRGGERRTRNSGWFRLALLLASFV